MNGSSCADQCAFNQPHSENTHQRSDVVSSDEESEGITRNCDCVVRDGDFVIRKDRVRPAVPGEEAP